MKTASCSPARGGLFSLLLAAAPASASAILGACSTGDSTTHSAHTLVDSRDWYDPRSLDPARATDVPSGRAVAYLFDGLTRFSPSGNIEAALASRWEVSADGLRYTFHLRTGVRFHDGTPFTAKQVKSSFERVLNPATQAGTQWPLFPIAGARLLAQGQSARLGVETPNDSTVVITLEEPLAIFTKLLAMPVASILPDSIGPDFSEHPIGTGPWKLDEWQHDDYLRFVRNDEYFDGPTAIDTLLARIIPEPSTAVAEFEAGSVDVLYIPEEQTRSWQDDSERSRLLVSAPALRLWYIGVNTTRGPLSDRRVRQALAHAIDSPTLLDGLLAGRGSVAAGVIPPSLPGFNPNRQALAYDTSAARQLLREAGYPNGVDLELWSSQTSPWPRLAQTLQAYLGAVGIRLKLVQRDASAMRAAARAGQTDLVVKDWYADYPDAENFLYPLLHSANSGAGGNVSFYNNPSFDKLVDEARREPDSDRRNSLYQSADSLALQDMALVPLFFYNDMYAIQPWVKGFEAPVIFNAQRWTGVSLTR